MHFRFITDTHADANGIFNRSLTTENENHLLDRFTVQIVLRTSNLTHHRL